MPPSSFAAGRRRLIAAAALACAALPLHAAPTPATVAQWIHEAEHILRGQTSAAVMTMTIRKAAYERDYDLMVMTDDRGSAAKVLLRMLGPALWRGNATLKVADKISFFDPRTHRITVMSNSMLGDTWMGSHFTNDDLMRETDLAKHYRYELLSSRPGQDGDGQPTEDHEIALSPLPAAPVSWGKVVYRLSVAGEGRVYPRRVQYFKRVGDEQPARTLVYEEVRVLGDKPVPTRLTMSVAEQPGEYTRIDYKRLRFGVDFKGEEFSERAFR